MFLSLRRLIPEFNRQRSARISYLALVMGVIFYYVQGVHQYFIVILKRGMYLEEVIFRYIDIVNLALLIYVLLLFPVYYYYLNTRINLIYRVLLYFLIPSIISFILWRFYIYPYFTPRSFSYGSTIYGQFKLIMIISYLQGLTALFTIACVFSDVLINIIRLVIYLFSRKNQIPSE